MLKAILTQWKKWFRIQSIQRRILFGFVLLSMLSALGITVGSILVSYYNGYNQALDRLKSAQSLKNVEITNWQNSLQTELLFALNDSYNFEQIPIALTLAKSNQFYDWYNEAVKQRLLSLVSQSEQIEDYCILDVDGEIVLCAGLVPTQNDCAQETFFTDGLIKPNFELPAYGVQSAATCSVSQAAQNRPMAIVSRPVIDKHGNTVGVFTGLVSSQTLARILRDPTGLGLDGKALILNPERGLLLSDSFLEFSQAQEYIHRINDMSADVEIHAGIYKDHEGKTVLGVIGAIPDSDLKLITEQNILAVFQSLWLNLFVSLAIGILTVVITAITATFITRSITNPIIQLAQTATAISDGDMQRTVAVEGQDEIASLAQAFNSMTTQLRDLILNLEKRVGERTNELEAANETLQRRALQLETIAEASKKISSVVEMDDLLSDLVMFICATFKYTDARIYLLEGDILNLHAYSRKLETLLPSISMELECLNTDAVRSKRYVLMNDVSSVPDFPADGSETSVRSELVVPLKIGSRIIGTLDIISTEVNTFSPEDVLLLHSLGDQIAIAVENSRLVQRSLELAVHEERSRLARDLHDSVVQSLYSLNLLVSGWKRMVQNGDTSEVKEYFDRAGEITHQALKEMRLMVFQLQPRALIWEGLVSALQRRLEAVEHRAGVKTSLATSALPNLPFKVEEALYHIAQEALNNALKHSGETHVTVEIQSAESIIQLKVTDNGKGFDPAASGNSSGMGLFNMRQRAEELHGILIITSSPDAGTSITAILPLSE